MESGEILCEGFDISQSGAIICKHVARQGLPILSAQRDEPISDVDTGWQFTCGIHDHTGEDGELWCIKSVANLDDTVLRVIDNPIKRSFVRAAHNAPWQERAYESE